MKQDVVYRFGEFDLDTGRFLLLRGGEPLRLERKPLELLVLLAGSGGRLITRQEIAERLWGSEVFVDTEHGINTAVRKVRTVLGERPEQARYIQTVTGMGYRFLAPTEVLAEPVRNAGEPSPPDPGGEEVAAVAPAEPASSDAAAQGRRVGVARRLLLGAVAVLLLAAGAVAGWYRWGGERMAVARVAVGSSAGVAPAAGARSPGTVPEEAREQYRRGLYLYDRRDGMASAAAFRRAIELAPRFAPAYAGLALALDSQAKLSNGVPGRLIPEGVAAARQAIALDPASDEGYIALGSMETAFTWEWRDAELNLSRGLQINPRNATGHVWHAVLLQSEGHGAEAADEIRQAVADEPLSFFVVRMEGSVLYFDRQYDEALRVLARAREVTPQRPNVVDKWIAWVQEQRGEYDEAVAHDLLSLEQQMPAETLGRLRTVYRRRGWRAYWKARLEQMSPEPQGCALYTSGVAALRTGERERALGLLHRAAEQHCFWMGMVRVDPALDALRSEPRFGEIERAVYGADGGVSGGSR